MPLAESELGHLMSATLSVNGYGVDRVVALLPDFKERGLLDPASVTAMSYDEVVAALSAAGYLRGGFLPILSHRVSQLMAASADGRLDGLPKAVAKGDRAHFEATLRSVHGWGPATVETAWSVWRAALGL